jgi:hypothetical protein
MLQNKGLSSICANSFSKKPFNSKNQRVETSKHEAREDEDDNYVVVFPDVAETDELFVLRIAV